MTLSGKPINMTHQRTTMSGFHPVRKLDGTAIDPFNRRRIEITCCARTALLSRR
jgi:hypothetical protein